jgi:hypothetical protein
MKTDLSRCSFISYFQMLKGVLVSFMWEWKTGNLMLCMECVILKLVKSTTALKCPQLQLEEAGKVCQDCVYHNNNTQFQ